MCKLQKIVVDETLYVLDILEDMLAIEQAFREFAVMKNYKEFNRYVRELITSMNVIPINAEYEQDYINDMELLVVSTDFMTETFSTIGVQIAFEYRCVFSEDGKYFCHSNNYSISVGGNAVNLEEAMNRLLARIGE